MSTNVLVDPDLTPLIPLDLDRRRYLRLPLRAIYRAEREMCKLWGRPVNILNVFADISALTLNDLAILVWVGLQHDDPLLTLEQTQDLMTFDKLPTIFPALFEAWNAATQAAVPPEEGTDQAGPLSFHGVSSGVTPVLS